MSRRQDRPAPLATSSYGTIPPEPGRFVLGFLLGVFLVVQGSALSIGLLEGARLPGSVTTGPLANPCSKPMARFEVVVPGFRLGCITAGPIFDWLGAPIGGGQ